MRTEKEDRPRIERPDRPLIWGVLIETPRARRRRIRRRMSGLGWLLALSVAIGLGVGGAIGGDLAYAAAIVLLVGWIVAEAG